MPTTRRCIDDLADKLADCKETQRDPVTDTEFEWNTFVTTEVNGVLEVVARRYPEGSPVTIITDDDGISVRYTHVMKCRSVDLALEYIRRILAM